MADPGQAVSGARVHIGLVAAAGLIVFGFALVALLEFSRAWPGPGQGNWALAVLAVVVALLLGLAAARLVLGIRRASVLPTASDVTCAADAA
jgi:hypothetical protein